MPDKRPVSQIALNLGSLSHKWMSHSFSYRQKGVKRLVRESHFTEPMAQAILDSIFKELTPKNLLSLLDSELGNHKALDGFVRIGKKQSAAQGPGRILHIFSANVPSPAILSFVFGMLIKSSNVGRVSSRDRGILDIYLASLKNHDARLAASNTLIHSKREAIQFLKKADLVVAYGEDKTLSKLRKATPVKTPFIGYGTKFSASFFLRDSLSFANLKRMASLVAKDVWMFDHRGCLSPLAIYVQEGGRVKPADFAREIAVSLKALQKSDKDLFARFHAENERKILALKKVDTFAQSGWSVVYDSSQKFSLSSPRRVVVKPFRTFKDVLTSLKPYSGYLQAAVLEGTDPRQVWSRSLAQMGFNRITRAGKMQFPPLDWHHDGGFNLANWLKWTDLEP